MTESLKDLSLFATVAECGGFAKSADTLDLTASAVSKAIAGLEQRLGAKLYTRTTRTIKLTEAGNELYQRAQDILATVEEAEADVSDVSSEPQGDLFVSCSDAFATLVLVPMLAEFQSRYPRIRIHVIQVDGPMDPVKEDYDLAIRSEEPIQKGLYIEALTPDPWVVCASPQYQKDKNTIEKPSELMEHRCLAIRARGRLDNLWTFRRGKRFNTAATPVFSGIGMVVKAAALRGLGIARLANFLVATELEKGGLVALLPDYQIKGQRNFYAVTQDRGYMPAKTRAFLTELRRFVQN
jgi:DNA-binding transcriptional LysR family regulator